MSRSVLAFLLTFTFGFPPLAVADTINELKSSGYETIWSGYAAITTCVHNDDAYELGPYLFVCNKFSYEYPYHYGDTSLLVRLFEYGGQPYISTFICLEPDDECIEGTLYSR